MYHLLSMHRLVLHYAYKQYVLRSYRKHSNIATQLKLCQPLGMLKYKSSLILGSNYSFLFAQNLSGTYRGLIHFKCCKSNQIVTFSKVYIIHFADCKRKKLYTYSMWVRTTLQLAFFFLALFFFLHYSLTVNIYSDEQWHYWHSQPSEYLLT